MKLALLPVKVFHPRKLKFKLQKRRKSSKSTYTALHSCHTRAREHVGVSWFRMFAFLLVSHGFFLWFYLQTKKFGPNQVRNTVAQWIPLLVPKQKSTTPRVRWAASMSLKRERKLSCFGFYYWWYTRCLRLQSLMVGLAFAWCFRFADEVNGEIPEVDCRGRIKRFVQLLSSELA